MEVDDTPYGTSDFSKIRLTGCSGDREALYQLIWEAAQYRKTQQTNEMSTVIAAVN